MPPGNAAAAAAATLLLHASTSRFLHDGNGRPKHVTVAQQKFQALHASKVWILLEVGSIIESRIWGIQHI